MDKQESFSVVEYSKRKKITKREEFLKSMDEIIPWKKWVSLIELYYPKGKRGRPPRGIETMLRSTCCRYGSLFQMKVQISGTLEHLKRKHLNTNYGNT